MLRYIVLLPLLLASPLPALHCAEDLAPDPATHFRNHRVGERPRLVLMTGLPGSGKFCWAHAAEHFGWTVITLDEYRDRTLARLITKGKKITVAGAVVTPEPLDPYHRLAVTPAAVRWARRDYHRALGAGKPVLWEGVFDQPQYRVEIFNPAREHGYYVESLSFESPSVEVNFANLVDRLHIGGRDLVPLRLAPSEALQRRQQILNRMFTRLAENPLTVRPRTFRVLTSETNDYVNRVATVPVARWENAMPPTAGVPWPGQPARQVILSPHRFRQTPYFRNGKKVRVVFLDADSTLRYALSGSVTANHGRDVMLLPGVAERIRQWNERGLLVAIVSNQGGVPRHISLEQADAALRYTVELLRQAGARVDYFDFAEGGNPNRKPGRGMADLLAENIRRFIDPQASLDYAHSRMIGDAAWVESDRENDDEFPVGRTRFDMSNSDRLFARAIRVDFFEPDEEEAFDWARRFGIHRFESAAQARAIHLRIAAGQGRR